jgi:hypothetical protein
VSDVTNLLFYIKNSRDYPPNQSIKNSYGYNWDEDNVGSVYETPQYSTSIFKVLRNLSRPVIIENNYSIPKGDTYNAIEEREIVKFTANTGPVGVRSDRSDEVISTMIVNHSEGSTIDNVRAEMNPNHDEDDNVYANYDNPATDYAKFKNIMGHPKNADTTKRRKAIFWQKIFTIIEFVKSIEKEFVSSGGSNPRIEGYIRQLALSRGIDLGEYNLNQTLFTKYLNCFIGHGKWRHDNYTAPEALTTTGDPIDIVPNLFRMYYLTDKYRTIPTPDWASFSSDTNNNWFTVGESDKLSNKHGQFYRDECYWSAINMELVEASVHHDFQNRIVSFTMVLKYDTGTNLPGTDSSVKEHIIKVYFDPDEYMRDQSDADFGLKVYTYNDLDMDGLDIPEPTRYNIYDNDYANATLPQDDPKRGSFRVNKLEVERSIVSALHRILEEGKYDGYVTLDVKRRSPILKETDVGTHIDSVVEWDDANSVYQTFYIFHQHGMGNGDWITEQMRRKAIADYLINLHSSANCHEESYYASDAEKNGKSIIGVEYIGHGQDQDKINFLSLMYPTLFDVPKVHIIPIGSENGNESFYNGEDEFLQETYFHPITPLGIWKTLQDYNLFGSGVNFSFTNTGSVDRAAGMPPIEIIYIGGKAIDVHSSQKYMSFNFPWLCVDTSEDTEDGVLKKLQAFKNYKQIRFDEGRVPSQPIEKLQYILLELARHMFVKTQKGPISKILDVSIASTFGGPSTIECIKVEFYLAEIQFTVYAQPGKNFGIDGLPAITI